MNKKDKEFWKCFLKDSTIFVIVIFSMFMLVGYAFNLTANQSSKEYCNKYREEYKIDARIEGNFFAWDGSYDCYIYTKDGLKIHLRDFDIAQTVEVKRLK